MEETKDIVVVTRHLALLNVLMELNILNNNVPIKILSHAKIEDVKGCHVFGVLPYHLASACASFTEITLVLPPELRGKELNEEQIKKYMVSVNTYEVTNIKSYQI